MSIFSNMLKAKRKSSSTKSINEIINASASNVQEVINKQGKKSTFVTQEKVWNSLYSYRSNLNILGQAQGIWCKRFNVEEDH